MGDLQPFGFDEAQYVFSDAELTDLLGQIENKAQGREGANGDVLLGFLQGEDNDEPLALQFQPRSLHVHDSAATLEAASLEVQSTGLPPLTLPGLTPNGANAAPGSMLPPALPQMTMPPPGLSGQLSCPLSLASPLSSGTAHSLPSSLASQHLPPQLQVPYPQLLVQVLPASAAAQLHQQQQLQLQQQQLHVQLPHPRGSYSGRGPAAVAAPETSRGSISHSTVEKQRRDRINSLIDELRELVPPQLQQQRSAAGYAIGASDNAEASARRPKHVVLADTIHLLKSLTQRLSFDPTAPDMQQQQLAGGGHAAAPAAAAVMCGGGVAVKAEPTGSSSQDDDDIGVQLRAGGSGVTVKRGPDCYYVQVACPDRKGLLSDITDTLRNLSLEVRTAAVTTTGGSVRDVFEVVTPEGAAPLAPEAVQSLVQGALSHRQQQLAAAQAAADVTAGKRPRA